MIERLLKLANILDEKGFYDEADCLDKIASSMAARSALTKALKEDDSPAVLRAIDSLVRSVPHGSTPQQELGISDNEFRELTDAIQSSDFDKARSILGVGKNVKQNPVQINPFTGRQWNTPAGVKDIIEDIAKKLQEVPKNDGAWIEISLGQSEDNTGKLDDAVDLLEQHGFTWDGWNMKGDLSMDDGTEIEARVSLFDPRDAEESDEEWYYYDQFDSDYGPPKKPRVTDRDDYLVITVTDSDGNNITESIDIGPTPPKEPGDVSGGDVW